MIRKILIVLTIITTGIAVHGQEGTTSAYSFYGKGLQKFRGTATSRMMGGLKTYNDPTNINPQNPASYADLKLTTYELGASRRQLTIKNETDKDKTATTSLDYLAIGVPAGKFGIGFGILPYTAVGYNLISVEGNGTSEYIGTGGMNRVFLGFAYKIAKGFNVGLEAQYNFGIIEDKLITREFGLQLGTRDVRKSELSGMSYTLGTTYQGKINKKIDFSASVILSPEGSIGTKTTRLLGSFIGLNVEGVELFDRRDAQNIVTLDRDIKLPTDFTVGLGFGQANKWFVSTEVTNQQANSFGSRTTEIPNVKYVNAVGSRIGGYYIPKYNSLTSYWNRIIYRAGMRLDELGLEINNEPVREFGMSFGVGLPIPRLFSTINVGAEVGRRGTTNAGLVQENFLNIFLGLSLNDRWFIKRKYD